MSLWVVATDTEVGKTVMSAVLMARYGQEGSLAYWKPVASGSIDERDTETVAALCPGAEILPESYLFEEPLSPHLAARLEGRSVDPRRLLDDHRRHLEARRGAPLVIEGVGGVLVPLRDSGPLLIELLGQIDAPCLVVARSTLGTINHTLLTLEALRSRRLPLVGVVLNGPPNPENRRAIEAFGEVDVIDEVDFLDPLDANSLRHAADGFDLAGKLRPWLVPAP